MQQHRNPMPNLGRMMVFVDGENLVFRYQAMIEEGLIPHTNVEHDKDVFVWNARCVRPGLHHVIRASYYTYATGSEETIINKCENIKSLTFGQYSVAGQPSTSQLINNLHPRIFRKIKGKKAKGVDIQMTVDILSNVYQNNLDTIYLISGDGDYKPVIEEAMRFGKQVFIGALSSGLNKELKYLADKFIDLDPYYVTEAVIDK